MRSAAVLNEQSTKQTMPPKRVTRGRKEADEAIDEDFYASGLETSGTETESDMDVSSDSDEVRTSDESFIDVSCVYFKFGYHY